MFFKVLAKFIFALHLFAIGFILLGWLLPSSWLLFHVIAIPLTVLQWLLNNDQCVLTQIQHKLEGKKNQEGEQGAFIKSLFLKMGWEPTEKQLFYLIYGLLLISFALSLRRLVLGI